MSASTDGGVWVRQQQAEFAARARARTRTIVTHGLCPDGVASAVLLHDALPEADVVYVRHGTEQHRSLSAREGMLFCDIAPPEARGLEFLEVGAMVLDHHRTARACVEPFVAAGLGAFGDEVDDPGVCGAVLAHDWVWLPLADREAGEPARRRRARAREFALRAGVRDTWLRDSPHWPAACQQAEVLLFFRDWLEPANRFPFDDDSHSWMSERLNLGALLVDRHAEDVARRVAESFSYVTHRGTRVVVFEGEAESSDAADLVGDGADLVVAFGYRCDRDVAAVLGSNNAPAVHYSLRSRGAFDCARLARAQGGGGHTRAAGFRVPLLSVLDAPNPYAVIVKLLATWDP